MQAMLEPSEWLRLRGRRYRIVERLSAGGEIVEQYRAIDPESRPGGDACAVHILPAGKKTLDYVRVLKRVSDRNRSFLPILAYNTWRDAKNVSKIVVVLPWLAGRTLREYLRASTAQRGPGISSIEAIRLYRGLAHGVCNLNHRTNIVHGDIKPENLIVAREPTQLVLIDYGSAWLVEETMTRTPLDGATRAYASPERLQPTSAPDFRSDQFSVSAVFYEMLTRTKPYGGLGGAAADPGNESFRNLVRPSAAAPDRDSMPDSVWKRVDTATIKGLALDRELRFRNRREWLDAVDDIDFEIKRTSRLDGGDKLIAGVAERVGRLGEAVGNLIRRLTRRKRDE
jgi:serine/threonine protein kinase